MDFIEKNKYLLMIAVIVVGAFLFMGNEKEEVAVGGTTNCTVTESTVVVGDEEALTILSAGIRTWAIVQQPLTATNTVSLSLGGTAVAGSGYQLGTTSGNAQPEQFIMGFATDFPTSEAITAITDSGSSTVNVISCR